MELDVTGRERNELLDREDIELDITHNGEATPSENDVRSKLAAELDLDPKTIRVDHVYTATGQGSSRAEVTVYDEPVLDELPEEDGGDEESEEAESDDADTADTEEQEEAEADTEDETPDGEAAEAEEDETDEADEAAEEDESAETDEDEEGEA